MESATPQRPPLFVAPLPSVSDGNGKRRIHRVLIANRGEIACRIIATCRNLNVTTIAVYVDEDVQSRHVSEADESICLGSATNADGNPFLNVKHLVDTAVAARADAVHPGYGYLSENGEFADAVREAGIIFVGPSSKAIGTLGDKRRSKEYLREHASDIPLVPGFVGSSQSVEDLQAAADDIGYPVMLKASAGGGGRGMRIVHERPALRENLERAQSEAKRSFGSSDCILEKYIESAKHIEVQIVGDSHGTVLALWERECSVQRRHQKVIEETPSPFLSPQQRQAMCAAAVSLGKLILYEGAGTVEFVVDAKTGKFYFLEVNTRLQVEHPITEEVTGLDIVALQLFVAAGGRLDSIERMHSIPQTGHAIECRLCAEDASNNFAPENGTIQLWKEARFTHGSRDVRYETAVQSGAKISIYFDSMIAKVVVWAPSRDLAIAKMAKVLANTACVGLKTNQLFLQSCLLHPGFRDPNYATSFISDNLETLLRNPYIATTPEVLGMLASVPSFLLRHMSSDSTARPFTNVRRSYKNQAFDPINTSASIVQPNVGSQTSSPFLCVWDNSRDCKSSIVTIVPLAEAPDSSAEDGRLSTAQTLTQQYAAVSQQLRHLQETPAPASQRYHIDLRSLHHTSPSSQGSSNDASLLEVAINGALIHAVIPFRGTNTSTSTSTGTTPSSQPTTLALHLPSIGTWLSYTSFTPLLYFEAQRDSLTSSSSTNTSSSSNAQRKVRAPMPCKVLDVLKKEGDVVEVGETVLVVESMKMETSVSCGVSGVLRLKVGKGEAVEEGSELCRFEEVEENEPQGEEKEGR